MAEYEPIPEEEPDDYDDDDDDYYDDAEISFTNDGQEEDEEDYLTHQENKAYDVVLRNLKNADKTKFDARINEKGKIQVNLKGEGKWLNLYSKSRKDGLYYINSQIKKDLRLTLGLLTKTQEDNLKIVSEELEEKRREEETNGSYKLGIDFPNFDRENVLVRETGKTIYVKLRGATYKKWYELYSDSKNKFTNLKIPQELLVKLGDSTGERDERLGVSPSQDDEEIEMERIPPGTDIDHDFLLQFSQDEINEIDSEIQKEQDKIIQLASDKKDEKERMGELKKQQDDLLTLVQQKGKLTEDVEKLRDEVGEIERRKEKIYEEHGTKIEMEGKINRLENQKRILTQTMKDKNVELKKVQKDTDSLKQEIDKQQKLDKDIEDRQQKLDELKEKRLKLMRISNLENDDLGNGLKEVGKKLANILPGLIGTIISFIFKAAGEVISFLGKNAWLLITAVVIFLVERISKR